MVRKRKVYPVQVGVNVVDRHTLPPIDADFFYKRWLAQYPDGTVIQTRSKGEALYLQKRYAKDAKIK